MRVQPLVRTRDPLAHVVDDVRVTQEQSIVVVTLLAASLAALLAGVSQARAAVAAAVVVQIALTWRLVLRASAKRDHVLDLIVDGRGDLAVRSVARERRRLLDSRHRIRLARSLDAVRDEATTPLVRRPSGLPLYRRRVVAIVAPELEDTARTLRREDAGLRGIALSERLLSGHDSPLYADDADRLREELRRIRFLLEARREPGSPPNNESPAT